MRGIENVASLNANLRFVMSIFFFHAEVERMTRKCIKIRSVSLETSIYSPNFNTTNEQLQRAVNTINISIRKQRFWKSLIGDLAEWLRRRV